MTTLSYFLLCFLALTLLGQNPPKDETPPGVMIRKCKWQKIGAGPTVDATFKAENDSPNGNASESTNPAPAPALRDRDTPFFLYSVELKNEGNKSIKAVLWDYLIIDSKTNEELGRHQFVSFEKVTPSGLKALTAKSRLSPSRIVTVQGSPPTADSTVVERVVLQCVVYEDGALWVQPATPSLDCEPLRKRAKK